MGKFSKEGSIEPYLRERSRGGEKGVAEHRQKNIGNRRGGKSHTFVKFYDSTE